MQNPAQFISCDVCGAEDPRFVLDSSRLDGPLVECKRCGLRYVGQRRSGLAFGSESAELTTAKVRAANTGFRSLPVEEEQRLARMNAQWRLDLIRRLKPRGKLLEAGCARGDFLEAAGRYFEVYGV